MSNNFKDIYKYVTNSISSLILALFLAGLFIYILLVVFVFSGSFVIDLIELNTDEYFKCLYITSVIISFVKIMSIAYKGSIDEPDKNGVSYWVFNTILSLVMSVFLGPIIFFVILIHGIKADI